MSEGKTKYGVNIFLNEVYVEIIDFKNAYKSPEYKYLVEIKDIEDYRGNGLKEMKIYTDGNLEIFEIGNWRISPIIKMPYNWSGFRDVLEIQDNNSQIISFCEKPDSSSLFSKEDYIKDIKWVFQSINYIGDAENVDHFEFLKHLKETSRLLSIYNQYLSIDTLLKIANRINYEIEKLKELAISEKNKTLATALINESISSFNSKLLYQI